MLDLEASLLAWTMTKISLVGLVGQLQRKLGRSPSLFWSVLQLYFHHHLHLCHCDIVNFNIPKSGPSFPSPYPTSSPPFPPLSLSPHFFLLLFLQCLLLLLLSFLLFLILILLHLNLPFHLQLLLHLNLNYWHCEPQWTDVRCFFISELVLVPISVSIALFLFLFPLFLIQLFLILNL